VESYLEDSPDREGKSKLDRFIFEFIGLEVDPQQNHLGMTGCFGLADDECVHLWGDDECVHPWGDDVYTSLGDDVCMHPWWMSASVALRVDGIGHSGLTPRHTWS